MARIHPTAVVAPGAKLAEDVQIGPYAVIGSDVELAPGVEVGSHVHIEGRTAIGSRTRIYPFVAIGTPPQIRGFSGETTTVSVGEDSVIREHSSIHVGTTEGGAGTRIGDDVLIMNNVHVAHDCRIGSHCVLAGYSGMGGHVVVDDYAVFGGMTGVHQFVRIGESVFTGANSMISKDAPPFARVAGDRARFAGINSVGLQRRGFSPQVIAALKHAFHILFQSKLRFEAAVGRVRRECRDAPEVERLLRFLERSERGFIR